MFLAAAITPASAFAVSGYWFDGEHCYKGASGDKSQMGIQTLSQAELDSALVQAKNSNRPVDLSCTQLYKLRIPRGTEFKNADLQGTKFEWMDLTDAKFDGAKMNAASLIDAKASGASFRNVSAYKAHFSGDFRNATLDGGYFYFAHLGDSDFRGASLQECFFAWSHFLGAKLKGAKFSGSIFSSDDPYETEFVNTDIWSDYASRQKAAGRQGYIDPYDTLEIRKFLLDRGFKDTLTLSKQDLADLAASHPHWNVATLHEFDSRNFKAAMTELSAKQAQDSQDDPTERMRRIRELERTGPATGESGEISGRASAGEVVKGIFDIFRLFDAASTAGRIPAGKGR